MNDSQEHIKHAAVMSEAGWIFIGKNHADCFNKMRNLGIKHFHRAEGQGFVTSKGRFVFRDKAGKIAFEAGQIDKETKLLFSEDMWCEKYQAKHTYDEVKGYILKEESNVI